MVKITFYVIYTDGTRHEERYTYNNISEAEEDIQAFTDDTDPFGHVSNFGKTVMMSGVIRPF